MNFNTMENNVYGRCSKKIDKVNIEFDTSFFLLRLLLFDRYVLNSINFKEIPYIISILGIDAFRHLLKENALSFHCESFTLADTGRCFRKPHLPLLSYFFEGIYHAEQIEINAQAIKSALRKTSKLPNLNKKKLKGIGSLLSEKSILYRNETKTDLQNYFYQDLGNKHLVQSSLALALSESLDTSKSDAKDISLDIRMLDKYDFKVETNLYSKFNLSEDKAHKLIERVFFNLVGLNQRLCTMRDFDSISGFQRTSDSALFAEKITAICDRADEKKIINEFERVITLKELPDFNQAIELGCFKAEDFIKVRNSEECKSFRSWLWGLKNASDEEIRERLDSLKSKIGNLASGSSGRIIRFIASAGIGVVNPIAGLMAGAVDSFGIPFLKKDGVKAFIDTEYPRLFQG